MTAPRIRPPLAADERTQLVGWLDLQRAILVWKCEGVSDADGHRPVLPTSPYMTLAGLVSHMRWCENRPEGLLLTGGTSVQDASRAAARQ